MASGSIRDSEINTAYTASGNTAYDKLKITVVGASFTPFWHCRAVLGRKGSYWAVKGRLFTVS